MSNNNRPGFIDSEDNQIHNPPQLVYQKSIPVFDSNKPKKDIKFGLPPKSPAGISGHKSARQRSNKPQRIQSPQGIINDPFMQTAFLIHESFRQAHLGGNFDPSYNQEEVVHFTKINRSNVPQMQSSASSRFDDVMSSSGKETPDFNKTTPRQARRNSSRMGAPSTPSDTQQQSYAATPNPEEQFYNTAVSPMLSPTSGGDSNKFPKLKPINVCRRTTQKQLIKQFHKQMNGSINPGASGFGSFLSNDQMPSQTPTMAQSHRYSSSMNQSHGQQQKKNGAHSNSTPDLQQYLQLSQGLGNHSHRGSQVQSPQINEQEMDLKQFHQTARKKSGSAVGHYPTYNTGHHPQTYESNLLLNTPAQLPIPKSQGSRNHNLAKSQSQPNGVNINDVPQNTIQGQPNNYELKLYMRHNYIRDNNNDQQVQLETVIKKTETINKMKRRNQISILDSVNYDTSINPQKQSFHMDSASGAQTERYPPSQKTSDFSLPLISKEPSQKVTPPSGEQTNQMFNSSSSKAYLNNLHAIIQRQQQKTHQELNPQTEQKLTKANNFRSKYLINQNKNKQTIKLENLQQATPTFAQKHSDGVNQDIISETKQYTTEQYQIRKQQSPSSNNRYQTETQEQPKVPLINKNPFKRKKVVVLSQQNTARAQQKNEDVIQDFYVDDLPKQIHNQQPEYNKETPPQSTPPQIQSNNEYIPLDFFKPQQNTAVNSNNNKPIVESRTLEDLASSDDNLPSPSKLLQQKTIEVDESYSTTKGGMAKQLFNVMSQQVLRNAIIHEDDNESVMSSRMQSRQR